METQREGLVSLSWNVERIEDEPIICPVPVLGKVKVIEGVKEGEGWGGMEMVNWFIRWWIVVL